MALLKSSGHHGFSSYTILSFSHQGHSAAAISQERAWHWSLPLKTVVHIEISLSKILPSNYYSHNYFLVNITIQVDKDFAMLGQFALLYDNPKGASYGVRGSVDRKYLANAVIE